MQVAIQICIRREATNILASSTKIVIRVHTDRRGWAVENRSLASRSSCRQKTQAKAGYCDKPPQGSFT